MPKNITTPDLDVYLYGMTVYSTIHLLKDKYPEPDTYGEIGQTYVIPGGETGNSALVLSRMGAKVKIDGPFLGSRTRDGILEFYKQFDIDCTGLQYDPTFDGVQDMVLVDKATRTVFGRFGGYFSEGGRWTDFDRDAVLASKIVSIDPFFMDVSNNLAEFCLAGGKPYVTIDCLPDSFLHTHASATVISNEYIGNNFKGEVISELFKRYVDASDGLVIFTFGSKEILYGRRNSGMQSLKPFKVEVAGTLGAGDTFRGGVVYGVLKGMSDGDIVKFAAATAACVCRRFPMALNPPDLQEILDLAGL